MTKHYLFTSERINSMGRDTFISESYEELRGLEPRPDDFDEETDDQDEFLPVDFADLPMRKWNEELGKIWDTEVASFGGGAAASGFTKKWNVNGIEIVVNGANADAFAADFVEKMSTHARAHGPANLPKDVQNTPRNAWATYAKGLVSGSSNAAQAEEVIEVTKKANAG